MIIRGSVAVLLFDEDGTMRQRTMLDPEHGPWAMEIPQGTWHTLIALKPATVAFEVKPGPYMPLDDKDFAAWAPREGGDRVEMFLNWFQHGEPGTRPPVPDQF